MKKTIYRSRILRQVLLVLLVFPLVAYSQEDMVEYFPGGVANARLLTQEYIRPAAEGGASAINSGWYSSGKPHAKFGFEISITFNTYFVPSEDEFYDATNLALSGLSVTTNATQVPTLFGPKGIAFNPIFQINDGSTNDGVVFAGPDGSPPSDDFIINALVVPTLQGSIGLWKETELKIRFAPTLKFGGTEYSTFGFGLMHSIKQYIPSMKNLPFGWSIFAGWTKSSGC